VPHNQAVFDGESVAIAARYPRRTQARVKCRAVVKFDEDKWKLEGQLEAMESSGCQVVRVYVLAAWRWLAENT
jgi:hypothetical protein